MATESVQILIEAVDQTGSVLPSIDARLRSLGFTADEITPRFDALDVAMEDARDAMGDLETATNSYIDTVEEGESAVEMLGSAIGKLGAVAAAFGGGFILGRRISEAVIATTEWAQAMARVKEESEKIESSLDRRIAKRAALALGEIESRGSAAEVRAGFEEKKRLLENEIKQHKTTLEQVREMITDDGRIKTDMYREQYDTAIKEREKAKENILRLEKEMEAVDDANNAQAHKKRMAADKVKAESYFKSLQGSLQGAGAAFAKPFQELFKQNDPFIAQWEQQQKAKKETEKLYQERIKEEAKFQKKRDAAAAKSFLFGTDTDQDNIKKGEREAEKAFKDRKREEERARKEGIRERISAAREELRELGRKKFNVLGLQGKDSRLGGGTVDPLQALRDAAAKAAEERKQQLKQVIDLLQKQLNKKPGEVEVVGP